MEKGKKKRRSLVGCRLICYVLVPSGKMFQAPDLNLIVEFIFMFYKEKPIDWLLDHILWVKVCNPEKDAVRLNRYQSPAEQRVTHQFIPFGHSPLPSPPLFFFFLF